jgi:8-oxo-dGTP diphosphatase
MRRFDDPPRHGQRYRVRPGVYAIIHDGRRILLTEQAEPGPEIQLPGGGIDPGEAVIPALHREVIEETGWTIRPERRLGVYQRFTYMPEYDLWARKICVIYAARAGRRLSPPLEAGHRALWMTPGAALAALANDGDRHYLDRFLRRIAG